MSNQDKSKFVEENQSLSYCVKILGLGGVGVFPTDTLYGLVGSALDERSVNRIYRIKGRDTDKPLIILLSSIKELTNFGISLSTKEEKIVKRFWPGKVSIILPCENAELEYLTREGKTLSFRIPDKVELIEVLKKTGPLVAPSANPQGHKPATNINEARKYFGDKVDFYFEDDTLNAEPSTVIKIVGDRCDVIREGAVKIGDDK
jgi:L-threonylcarbamoyladenylate synthase